MDSPQERQASRFIYDLLRSIGDEGTDLQRLLTPEQGSSLDLDDSRLSGYPLSNYVFGQLNVSFGCLDALRRLIVREDQHSVRMTAGPHGTYALIRNAMDTAAIARWLLQPMNRNLRIKRRLMAEMDEVTKSLACRMETHGTWNEWAERRRIRMQEVADLSGVGTVNVRALKLPPTTVILREIQRGHSGTELTWLGAWQLCSGHAHGKMWASLATNDLELLNGTETSIGAQYRMTVNYGSLFLLLERAIDLLHNAADLYARCARSPVVQSNTQTD